MADFVTINGEAAMVFQWLPNWQTPFEKTMAYKTEVFSSYSQIEQRRALRASSRDSYSFMLSGTQEKMRSILTTAAGWQRRLFLVPDVVRSVRFDAALPPAANRVVFSAVPWWVKIGRYVMLEWRGQVGYRRVSDIQGVEVFFSDVDSSSWPVGAKVRPMYSARLLSGVPTRALTSATVQATFDFSLEPAEETDRVLGDADGLFDGLEVYYKRPNWATPLSIDHSAKLDLLDFDRGRRHVRAPSGFSGRTQKLAFLNRDAADADHAEAFFHRMKGRRGTFYMPTWTKDLVPHAAIEAGEKQMVVRQIDVAQMLADDTAHKAVVLIGRDGSKYPNRVTSIQAVGGGYGLDWGLFYGQAPDGGADDTQQLVTLNFRDEWPVSLEPSEVVYASWLMACRFASDSQTFQYPTEDVSQFQMSITQIRDLGPDSRSFTGWGFNWGFGYGGDAA